MLFREFYERAKSGEFERAYQESLKRKEEEQDRHYEALGDLIDKHPLGSPRAILRHRLSQLKRHLESR